MKPLPLPGRFWLSARPLLDAVSTSHSLMPMLAIAALSARALTEAALADGHQVLALDVFGDVDTQRAAAGWWPVGDVQTDGQTEGSALRIHQAPLCTGLLHAASQGAVGWIAGSGFEADLDLLQAGAAVLPLIGNPAPVWRAVRDPAQFFGCLHAAGLPHPAWQASMPTDTAGWLVKDPGSSGGSAVQHLAQWRRTGQPLPTTAYVQRLLAGQPVSLTFVANGRRALVLGANQQQLLGANQQQLPAPVGDGACAGRFADGYRPFRFGGIIGPVALPAPAEATLHLALGVLVAHFQLRGLGSLDALLDGDQVHLLELNPRPPASLQLYPAAAGQGVVAAHLNACLHGRLPPAPWPTHAPLVRGLRLVHTPTMLYITSALSAQLAAWPGVQDVPPPGTHLASGDPLCSLHCGATSVAAVQAVLGIAQANLLRDLGIVLPTAGPLHVPATVAESLPT